MITLKKFAEEITTLFDKQFDESFNELIQSSIIGYRSTILKQEFDKNGRFPRGSEQSICLEVINVKATECCASEDLDCSVRRTRYKVPSAVRTNLFADPYLFVGTSNMEKAFSYAKTDSIKYIIDSSKFLQNSAYYDSFNDYIYVFNYEGGKVGIRDVFSNPQQLLELINCDGQPCLDEIYIDDDMKRVIKQLILEEFRSVRHTPIEQQIRLNESSI